MDKKLESELDGALRVILMSIADLLDGRKKFRVSHKMDPDDEYDTITEYEIVDAEVKRETPSEA